MMAQLRIDFQGRSNIETFPRARVQPMGQGVQLALGVARQVRALGLGQQPIRVFIRATLPREDAQQGKKDIPKSSLVGKPSGRVKVKVMSSGRTENMAATTITYQPFPHSSGSGDLYE
jgi:hypothetical protein